MIYRILHQDESFVAVDKPAGHFVHRPEDPSQHAFVPEEKIILSRLRRQIGRYLYPVHRLDVATSGVLVFALSPESARAFADALQAAKVYKTYRAVCRGWPQENFRIELPLELDSTRVPMPAVTEFRCLQRILTAPIPGSSFPHSLYTLLEARPLTGRFHQIRRHLNRVSHPIIGDNDHGDSRHNRFFREQMGIRGLCLRATELRVDWPNGRALQIRAPQVRRWAKIQSLFDEKGIHAEPHQLRQLDKYFAPTAPPLL